MHGLFEHRVLLRFSAATGVIALLFAVLRADPTQSFGFGQAFVFWLAHVGAGLACCIAMVAFVNRMPVLATVRPIARLLIAGVVASLVFAPIAVIVEHWLPSAPELETDSGLIADWEAQGGVLGVVAEWLHLAPAFLLTWGLLNWGAASAAVAREQAAPATATIEAARPGPAREALGDAAVGAAASAINNLIDSLPPAVGRDVVYVSADLHYLHVHTSAGKATVLGGLSCWERQQGEQGIRIHRSHWVARRHVRRVACSAAGWYCELHNATKLPLSRRRAGAVREMLGSSFAMRAPAGSTTAAPSLRAGQEPNG
jgi:hypothetical protein